MTHGWILVQTEVGQSFAFLKMVADQEILYSGIISHARLGKYVWAWLVNEDNWARRLGHYTVGFSHLGPVGWRVWAKAHGTHNAPIFSASEGSLSRLEKENFCDWLSVGNNGLLMLVCSNVRITREFSNFLVSHLMRSFGILLKLEVSIKGL